MEFFDSVAVRMSTGLAVAILALLLYYSFDVYQFFSNKDYGHANVYLVHFTRHDKDSHVDKVFVQTLGYKIALREIFRNRFLLWLVTWKSLIAGKEQSVLKFKNHERVLSPVRGRVSQLWSGMVLKRAGGFAFTEHICQLALVCEKPRKRSGDVLRIVLVTERDIKNFETYLEQKPVNKDNFEFTKKIVEAYKNGTGSFIKTRVTIA